MEEKRSFVNDVSSDDVGSILEEASAEKLPRRFIEGIQEPQIEEVKESITETVERKEAKEQPGEKKESPKSSNKNFLPKVFKKGEIISVTVVKIEPNGVLVSAGGKEDIFIPLHGLSLKEILTPDEVVQVGDRIDVFVMKEGRSGGGAILSKKMADYIKKWNNLKEKFTNGEFVKGTASKAIKGGLLVDVNGITAFLPQSQIGLKRGEKPENFVAQELELNILELDKSIKRVVVSRIKLLEEMREKERKQVLVSLKKGEIYEGTVRSIQDFGVFVDLGNGIEGLVRVNELTWGRRKSPHEILKVGEAIKAKIIGINLDTERVLLSLKQTKPYPWDIVSEKFPINSTVEGTVIRIHPFGAVLEIDDGLTGLVHISQLDKKRVNKVEEVVNIGDKLQVKVIAIDKENKKIKLSRRALLEDEHE